VSSSELGLSVEQIPVGTIIVIMVRSATSSDIESELVELVVGDRKDCQLMGTVYPVIAVNEGEVKLLELDFDVATVHI